MDVRRGNNSDSINNKVEVCVRCCPINVSLVNHAVLGSIIPVKRCVAPHDSLSLNINDTNFTFDRVFGEDTTQKHLYDECFYDLVSRCFHGNNATIFAYGQTGSGKTHSIVGDCNDEHNSGIIPRALHQIFHKIHEQSKLSMTCVTVSYLEIYNEEVRDLLHPEVLSKDIHIREDREGNIFFTGARDEVVATTSDALHYLFKGNNCRSTAETNLNLTSSRSHAIFTVNIELSLFNSDKPQQSFISSRLHLVDLAGSERASRTKADGVRFKESIGINQGLLSLGKVIRALSSLAVAKSTSNKTIHVPYRESKLTRFLQDSLGGNSYTTILACISTANINLHETLSTLEYASRARNIQNKATINIKTKKVKKDTTDGVVTTLKHKLLTASVDFSKNDVVSFMNQLSKYNSSDVETLTLMMTKICEAQNQLQGVVSSPDACIDDVIYNCSIANDTLLALIKQLCTNSHRLVSSTTGSISDHQKVSARGDSSTSGSSSSSTSGSSSSSSSSSGNGSTKSDEIVVLKLEIESLRDDLRRDEDIFAEKIKELKKAKRLVRKLQAENTELYKVHHQQQQQSNSSSNSRSSIFHANGEVDDGDEELNMDEQLEISKVIEHYMNNESKLQEVVDTRSKTSKSSAVSTSNSSTYTEVTKQLNMERDRRMQVEQRNSDLNREIRHIRQQLKDMQYTYK